MSHKQNFKAFTDSVAHDTKESKLARSFSCQQTHKTPSNGHSGLRTRHLITKRATAATAAAAKTPPSLITHKRARLCVKLADGR